MSALAHGPNVDFHTEGAQESDRFVGDGFIEPTHQSLIRPEHDGADHPPVPPSAQRRERGVSIARTKARRQPELDGPVVVRERAQ